METNTYSGLTIASNSWVNIAFVYDSSGPTSTLYVDGVKQGTPKSLNGTQTWTGSAFPLALACNGSSLTVCRTCRWDLVRFWEKVLVQDDIDNLYNEGNGLAYSEFD